MVSVGSDRLPDRSGETLTDEQQALYDSIVGGDRATQTQHFPLTDQSGALNGPFGVMLNAPAVGDALQGLGAAIRFRTELGARIREIAILQTAQATGSRFEWWAHSRVGRAAGLSEEEITQLATGCFESSDAVESAAAALCRSLLSTGVVTDAEFAAARRHLDHRRITELATLVGYYRLLASLMNVYDVGVPGEDPAAPSHHGHRAPAGGPAETTGAS